jgi:Tol biopolymer transport system component
VIACRPCGRTRWLLGCVVVVIALLGVSPLAASAVGRSGGSRSSPVVGEIVFNLDNQVWTENSNGSDHTTQLLSDNDLDQEPVWSPTRDQIAFVRQVGTGTLHIVVLDLISHKVRAVTNDRHDAYLPAWSPNGKELAFVSQQTIRILDLVSGKVRRLGRGLWPAWSADGRYVAYTRFTAGAPAIYERSAIGNAKPVRLTPQRIKADTAAFSPNGKLLAFSRIVRLPPRNEANNDADLDVMNLKTGKLTVLARGHDTSNALPSFAPNSKQVVYDSNRCLHPGGGCSDTLKIAYLTSSGRRAKKPRTNIGLGNYPNWRP